MNPNPLEGLRARMRSHHIPHVVLSQPEHLYTYCRCLVPVRVAPIYLIIAEKETVLVMVKSSQEWVDRGKVDQLIYVEEDQEGNRRPKSNRLITRVYAYLMTQGRPRRIGIDYLFSTIQLINFLYLLEWEAIDISSWHQTIQTAGFVVH